MVPCVVIAAFAAPSGLSGYVTAAGCRFSRGGTGAWVANRLHFLAANNVVTEDPSGPAAQPTPATTMPLALVQYASSDSECEPEGATSLDKPAPRSIAHLKRKRSDATRPNPNLPPLPAAFHDLYSANARASTSDDPSLHRGRRRAVPHIQGNWPSHVYLEWLPSQPESNQLDSLINHVRSAIAEASSRPSKAPPIPEIHSSLLSDLGTLVPLHVSLSRTLQIKTEDREDFLDTLTASLRRAAVRPFNVRFTALKWVSNYERNRWFLVLGMEKPAQDELNRLLDACNDAAQQCGHAPLYIGGKGDGPMEAKTRSDVASDKKCKRQKSVPDEDLAIGTGVITDRTHNYHISIAWNLEEPAPEWIALAQSIDVSMFITSPQAPFESVKAKIGNSITNIGLDPRKASLGRRNGLLGLA